MPIQDYISLMATIPIERTIFMTSTKTILVHGNTVPRLPLSGIERGSMVTAISPMASWGARYASEVEAAIRRYDYLNLKQPVYARKLTQEEMNQLFNGNPNYIKNIGRNIDGKEWKELTCSEKNGAD